MAKRKKIRTRWEILSFKERTALPEDEQDKIWNEHVEELKARGDYNENAGETFFLLLDKVCAPRIDKA